MNNFYNEIELLIKKHEISKQARILEDNSDVLRTNWEIGKLIVEAQGGEKRSKYGNKLIKEWSTKLTKLYGNGYDFTNLSRFRQFYMEFQIIGTLCQQLTWSHIRYVLPIKDENKRNFYINKCIENNLSVRELIKEIKSKSFERLLNKPEKIEIIKLNNQLDIRDNIMNPIIFELNENEKILTEHDLEMKILSDFQAFARQLGSGYALIGNQVKIVEEGKVNIIDLLLFNYKQNRFIVIELKTRELYSQDKGQIKAYMNLVDKHIKENFHNKTVGILITKLPNKKNNFIVEFISEENVIPITYVLKEEDEYICE